MVRQASRSVVLLLCGALPIGCVHKGSTRPDDPPAAAVADKDKKPQVPPPKPGTPPSTVFATFSNKVDYGTDPVSNKTIAGVSGRVYLMDENGVYALTGEGKMSVQLYDDSARLEGKPSKLLEQWNFDPATLKSIKQKDYLGEGFTMSLPWSTYRTDICQFHLAVRFEPTKGNPISWSGRPTTVDHGQDAQLSHAAATTQSTLVPVSATN
jgi:hypothetical protein